MSIIAKTIFNQIEKGVLMSLGARQFHYGIMSLSFKANKRDTIFISLNEWDLYDIRVYSGNMINYELEKTFHGVHVELLNGILLSLDK